MKFDRKQRFVCKVRQRARKLGCKKCHRHAEVGISGDESLNQMMRRGADLREVKAAIRSRGWFCRACVRKKKGAVASASLRDQYDMTDPAQRLAYRIMICSLPESVAKMKAKGYVLSEDRASWGLPPDHPSYMPPA